MFYKFQYYDKIGRQTILDNNKDKVIYEEQNIIDGNFLILTDVSAEMLNNVKQFKISQMKDIYNQKLTSSFSSLATGTVHEFAYDDKSQKKFMKLAIDISDGITIFPVPIPDKDGNVVMHDQIQYQQLRKDISAFEWDLESRLVELVNPIGLIMNCKTIYDINNINW